MSSPKNLKRIPYISAMNVIRDFTDAARETYGSDSYATGYLSSVLASMMAHADLKEAILQLQNQTDQLKSATK